MSSLVTPEPRAAVPWRRLPVAWCVANVARILARQPPQRLRRLLAVVMRGSSPATHAEALRARQAVVAASIRCRGRWCLERSIAVVLLCRLGGSAPQWCTGVRTEPFSAHAWVVAQGIAVGEDAESIRLFRVTMAVPAGSDR